MTLELETAAVVEVDGQLVVVLRRDRVSAEGSGRKHFALLRTRRSQLVNVGVVVRGVGKLWLEDRKTDVL